MSTPLRGVETFDFLLKHDNAQKKRRKVIRVVLITVVVLTLLIGSAALLKSIVIVKNSNDSTRPPNKPIFLPYSAGPGGDGDTCQIDLEERKGKFPPFVLRNSDELVYPEGSRILNFGINCFLNCYS